MLGAPWIDAVVAGVLGLLVGSFLNVVVHRMPRMLGREWWEDVHKMMDDPEGHKYVFDQAPTPGLDAEKKNLRQQLDTLPALTLARPRSRCPHCGHQIAWYENIPVLSWLALRGKCSACKAPISPRYPIVELVTGAFFALCAWRWGISPQAAAWAAFAALLICLFLIDMDTFILPDDLNYILLWLGLLVAAIGWTVPLRSAVLGAFLGYMSLWLIFQGYKLLTGKEGMGYGDFKLLAALGAWLGAEYLLAIILLSSVVGAVIGILLLVVGRLANKDIPMPFGPYLAGAGLLALIVGPTALPALVPFAFPFGPNSAGMAARIGLTGGIGSGKSTVLGMLVERGAFAVDADAISRATTAVGGAALPEIVRRFGPEFIAADGALDRARMRERTFGHPASRKELEAIIHPLVGQEVARQVDKAVAAGAACIVFDIPLLVESGRWRAQVERVLVVDCEPETQVQRVVARSGLKPEEVRAIIAAQAPRALRLAAADLVICNEALTLEALRHEVAQAAAAFGL